MTDDALVSRWLTAAGSACRAAVLDVLQKTALPKAGRDLARVHQDFPGVAGITSPSDLRGIDLSGENLSGAYLDHLILDYARLDGCQLVKANLTCSGLFRASLKGVVADRMVFGSTNACEASFDRAELTDAFLHSSRLRGASFREAKLLRTDFVGSDLSGSDFTGAWMENTVLRGADLEGAHFRDARMSGVDLSSAKVDGALLPERR